MEQLALGDRCTWRFTATGPIFRVYRRVYGVQLVVVSVGAIGYPTLVSPAFALAGWLVSGLVFLVRRFPFVAIQRSADDRRTVLIRNWTRVHSHAIDADCRLSFERKRLINSSYVYRVHLDCGDAKIRSAARIEADTVSGAREGTLVSMWIDAGGRVEGPVPSS